MKTKQVVSLSRVRKGRLLIAGLTQDEEDALYAQLESEFGVDVEAHATTPYYVQVHAYQDERLYRTVKEFCIAWGYDVVDVD